MTTFDISSLTLGQIRDIAAIAASFSTSPTLSPAPALNPTPSCRLIGHLVIVRTYSAGVHIGRLLSENGTRIELEDARRLWSWQGAFTLNEVASKGVDPSSRVSDLVPYLLLTEGIEIIPVSAAAEPSLRPNQAKE